MINRFNDPTDLATIKLECKPCGAVQKVILRADDKLSEAKKTVRCSSCSEVGRFILAKNESQTN